MKDTCKQTSQHRRAPRAELICTRGDQPKSRIRIFQQISEVAQIQGPKGLASMPATLLYSAAGVCMQHFMSLFRGRASLCLPRGQYNSWSKHFFIRKQAVIRHCKQEGLQPSLVALFKDCKQPGSKGLLLCTDFSPTSGGGKVGGFGGCSWGFGAPQRLLSLR